MRQTIKTIIPITNSILEIKFFPGLKYIAKVLGKIKEMEFAAVEPTILNIFIFYIY